MRLDRDGRHRCATVQQQREGARLRIVPMQLGHLLAGWRVPGSILAADRFEIRACQEPVASQHG